MKNNKAANISGLTVEHTKFGGDTLIVYEILSPGKFPDVFQNCVITLMYKKPGKPVNDPNSYRRVTITSIIDKLVKKVHLDSISEMLGKVQNKLQRGYINNTFPSIGSFILTETIAEYINSRCHGLVCSV